MLIDEYFKDLVFLIFQLKKKCNRAGKIEKKFGIVDYFIAYLSYWTTLVCMSKISDTKSSHFGI